MRAICHPPAAHYATIRQIVVFFGHFRPVKAAIDVKFYDVVATLCVPPTGLDVALGSLAGTPLLGVGRFGGQAND